MRRWSQISDLLSVKLDVRGLGADLPKDGAFLILGNHPTGITDGIALYDAVKHETRPDVSVLRKLGCRARLPTVSTKL